VVRVAGKTSNAMNFNIGALITGVSPPTALVGNSVTITGNGFGTSGGTVTFNGIAATTSGWTDASIVAQVPNGATAGPIVVTVNGQVSNGMPFTPTPSITSLSPNFGLSGVTVTLAGNSFGAQQGTNTVSFNGVIAAVSAWNNTSITVTAPGGALTGNVVVTVNGVASGGQVFTYTPQISGLSPSPALADTAVTVQGINFGGQQNNSTVTFNGVTAAVSNWNNTSIAATVPGTATPGLVVVTVNGVASNGVSFAFPALYSFSLGYAPNGDVLTANDSVNGNWTYSYDDFNRLATSSSPQQAYNYAYDEYGNRWNQTLTAGTGLLSSSMTFKPAATAITNGNCYHAAGLTNQADGFCHDAAGNLLSDGQHNYTYDAEGRIIVVDANLSTPTATYSYDAAGQRIQKVSSAGTSAFLYDLGGHVVTEVNGMGVWTRGEVYAGGKHLATYSSGTTYLVQADWLGTERTRLLPNGDLFETCTSLPFGDGLICNGSADPSPNHLTGKPRDTETGNDYFGVRYNSSGMGRFMTPDPFSPLALKQDKLIIWISNPQHWNKYAYVLNNPLTLIDLYGLNACGTKKESDCVVTIVIMDRSKDKKGNYNDEFKDVKNQADYNATATVLVTNKETGTTTNAGTFLARTVPSDTDMFPTTAAGGYIATATTHNGHTALRLQPSDHIPILNEVNPAHPERDYATGILVHIAGKDNYTGLLRDAEHGVSEGCILVCRTQFSDFLSATGADPSVRNQQFRVLLATDANMQPGVQKEDDR
jgi:RHS repeat-associated protein